MFDFLALGCSKFSLKKFPLGSSGPFGATSFNFFFIVCDFLVLMNKGALHFFYTIFVLQNHIMDQKTNQLIFLNCTWDAF